MSSSVVKAHTAKGLPQVEWRTLGVQKPPHPGPPAPKDAASSAAVDVTRIEKEAFERGFRDGEAAAARKGQEQFQIAIQALAQSTTALASYKPALRTEAERELVNLALAVARKILRRELSIDPHIILAVVKSCLNELQNVEIYRLRLNPQDVPAVGAFLQQQRQENVQIVPDPQITRGGALFETARGEMDARLESQLEEIERGLADRN